MAGQPKAPTSRPPTLGPTTAPSGAMSPTTAMARPLSSGAKLTVAMAMMAEPMHAAADALEDPVEDHLRQDFCASRRGCFPG
jgi:hypothetical protein